MYKPSAAKMESGGFLGLAGQPSLVGEFQTSDKLLLTNCTNKTSDLHHTHTHRQRAGGKPAHTVTPQEICICLSLFWNHTDL